ncbi:MAG TPA: hypothetical protein VFG63_10855 [Nocardioidaceae bacterium]|nr:hypothetical protein [Nocardioidaceae bacterium]
MGLFDSFRGEPATQRPTTAHHECAPPVRGQCSCWEHVDEILELVVPYTREMQQELGDDPMTVEMLIECEALGVEPTEPDDRWMTDHTTGKKIGPIHWQLWLGDEARASYDDDAPLELDDSLAARPGVERVVWEDREVFHVVAPTLCRDGMLAAAARALLEPQVRIS